MTIHWAHTDSENAADALAAVERALGGSQDSGQGAPGGVDPRLLEILRSDPYLAENVTVAHASWAVDQGAIVVSRRPMLGWAINRFQRLARRATWWYTAPQWEQANVFHGAVVRVLASLIKNQHWLAQRFEDVAGGHVLARTALLEQQILALREEQRALRERVAELEARLEQ
jgi:hypothetical protein